MTNREVINSLVVCGEIEFSEDMYGEYLSTGEFKAYNTRDVDKTPIDLKEFIKLGKKVGLEAWRVIGIFLKLLDEGYDKEKDIMNDFFNTIEFICNTFKKRRNNDKIYMFLIEMIDSYDFDGCSDVLEYDKSLGSELDFSDKGIILNLKHASSGINSKGIGTDEILDNVIGIERDIESKDIKFIRYNHNNDIMKESLGKEYGVFKIVFMDQWLNILV